MAQFSVGTVFGDICDRRWHVLLCRRRGQWREINSMATWCQVAESVSVLYSLPDPAPGMSHSADTLGVYVETRYRFYQQDFEVTVYGLTWTGFLPFCEITKYLPLSAFLERDCFLLSCKSRHYSMQYETTNKGTAQSFTNTTPATRYSTVLSFQLQWISTYWTICNIGYSWT